ncbi:nuclear transport factor 2 family protein [Streptomyces nojiriensis]|uniref:nuclear transport factor 2 family protein n=1 Tax=Streptomyces nojiriensis TaxID=66374 RepID=UPI0035DF23AE
MIAELHQAVANHAHALGEPNVPELEAVLTEDTTWTFTMPGQGVLGPVAGRAAALDLIRDGHTAQTGRVRHHLDVVVVTTTDAATAEVRAHLVHTRNTGESIQMISTGLHVRPAPGPTAGGGSPSSP